MASFIRLNPMVAPLMDNMKMEVQYFFCPLRLLWDNFQRFMGEQPNPGDSTDFLVPQITTTGSGFAQGTLYDYFGLPLGGLGATVLSFSAFYCRAYNLIWNEWYRDQRN